jgi:hypothetical protein
VVHMPNRPHVHMRLLALVFRLRHMMLSASRLGSALTEPYPVGLRDTGYPLVP